MYSTTSRPPGPPATKGRPGDHKRPPLRQSKRQARDYRETTGCHVENAGDHQQTKTSNDHQAPSGNTRDHQKTTCKEARRPRRPRLQRPGDHQQTTTTLRDHQETAKRRPRHHLTPSRAHQKIRRPPGNTRSREHGAKAFRQILADPGPVRSACTLRGHDTMCFPP